MRYDWTKQTPNGPIAVYTDEFAPDILPSSGVVSNIMGVDLLPAGFFSNSNPNGPTRASLHIRATPF